MRETTGFALFLHLTQQNASHHAVFGLYAGCVLTAGMVCSCGPQVLKFVTDASASDRRQ